MIISHRDQWREDENSTLVKEETASVSYLEEGRKEVRSSSSLICQRNDWWMKKNWQEWMSIFAHTNLEHVWGFVKWTDSSLFDECNLRLLHLHLISLFLKRECQPWHQCPWKLPRGGNMTEDNYRLSSSPVFLTCSSESDHCWSSSNLK